MSSSFEGTEKKFEIVVDPRAGSLRRLGSERWTAIVRAAEADVVDCISGEACDAYLLSESSLFVFDDRAIMLTCGRTSLHRAVLELLCDVDRDHVRMFFYERKNEVYPHAQPTSFFDDVTALQACLPGRAFRFGNEDEHHLYLFHLDRPYPDADRDSTLEILMYGIAEDRRRDFSRERHPQTSAVRAATGIDRLLPSYQVSDHLFEPTGYSLNAIKGDRYYTVHVTPEGRSYASFETNEALCGPTEAAVERVLDLFRPQSYDVITFNGASAVRTGDAEYRAGARIRRQLSCGFDVQFIHMLRPDSGERQATELTIERQMLGTTAADE